MTWKRIGSGWDTDRGGISLAMNEGETFTRAFLFPVREKKQSKSPDWDLCVKTDVADDRPRHEPREREEAPPMHEDQKHEGTGRHIPF